MYESSMSAVLLDGEKLEHLMWSKELPKDIEI